MRTKTVVDATGDADVAHLAGCPTKKGRDEDGMMTPGSLIFIVEDVDSKAVEDYCLGTGDVRYRRVVKPLQEKGEWPFPFEAILLCEMPHRGIFFINTLRELGVDGTDEVSLTKAMVHSRSDAKILMDILVEHVPGFERARMTNAGSVIGIRETRRIVGESHIRELMTPF